MRRATVPDEPTATPAPSGAGDANGTTSEIVIRPEPGLARGRWEAPAWAFWALLGAVVLGATAYLLWRLGVLGRRAHDERHGGRSRIRP